MSVSDKIICNRILRFAGLFAPIWALWELLSGRSLKLRSVDGALFLGALAAYLATIFKASCDLGYPSLMTRLPRKCQGHVALTFDNAPDLFATTRILEALAATQTVATFFVTNDRASRYPALMQSIADSGHLIALSGIDDQPMLLWRRPQIFQALRMMLRENPKASYFRPQLGYKSHTLQHCCDKCALTMVTWSLDATAARHCSDPVEIAARVVRKARSRDIIRLAADNAAIVDALPAIIDGLASRGFQLVVLPEPKSRYGSKPPPALRNIHPEMD